MSRQPQPVKEKVAAHRARQLAAGRQLVNTYLPGDVIDAIDRAKEAEGVRGRTPIIERALRFYFENEEKLRA